MLLDRKRTRVFIALAAAPCGRRGRSCLRRPAPMRAITNVALTIVLVLVAAVGPAVAQGKPIRIGEINSYSGLATVYTFPYKEGLAMAVKEINDAGGVL